MPEDKDEGNAGDGVPAPLLRSVLGAEGSKETSQDHDDISSDHHEEVSTSHAGKETEIEEQERGRDGPVDVTGPVDLAVGGGEGVGNMVVLLALDNLGQRDTVGGGHGEVGESSRQGDDGGDDVVETLVLWGVLDVSLHSSRLPCRPATDGV